MGRAKTAWRSWGVFCAAIAATMHIGSESALAADPLVVNVSALGADRTLPLGSAFTLQGAVEGDHVTEVRGIFVRTSYPFWGVASIGTEKDCATLSKSLKELKDTEPEQLGEIKSDEVWQTALDHDAFRLATWKKKKDAQEKTWSLLVPESAFFRPGATYCLYLYDGRTDPLDMKALAKALEAFDSAWGACESAKDQDDCQGKAITALTTASSAILGQEPPSKKPPPGAPPNAAVFLTSEDYTTAHTAFNKLNGTWLTLSAAMSAAKSNLGMYVSQAYRTPDAAPATTTPTPATKGSAPATPSSAPAATGSAPVTGVPTAAPLVYADAGKDSFARFLLPALARQGEVYPTESPSTGDPDACGAQPSNDKSKRKGKSIPADSTPREPQYRLANGEAIRCLAVSPDRKVFVAKGRPSETVKPERMTTNLSEVLIPGSKISMLDLLEYERGRIRINDKDYRAFNEVYAEVLAPIAKAPLSADRAPLERLLAQIQELLTVFERALSGAQPGGTPAALTGSQIVYTRLGEWLKASVLAAAFMPVSESPLKQMETELDKANTNLKTIADAKKVLEGLSTLRKLNRVGDVETRVAITQKSWVFQYVTPTVGIGWALGATEVFSFQYGGVKIYGFPNPADEPMWKNGAADVRRLFALELGLGAAAGAFGPDKRYNGVAGGSLPSVVLGLALQPAPYITTSFGATFMNARRSTLAQERWELFVSPYAAVALDFNVFDGIAGLVGTARGARIDAPPKTESK